MANKLYQESSVQAIANAIRAKSKSTDTYTISQMSAAINDIQTGAESQAISWHQCPELPRNFIAEVTYDPSDYTTSEIDDYAPDTPVSSNYKPIGKVIDGTTFYNQVPNKETPFTTEQSFGTLKPLDKVRYINTPSAPNVRDLGGWSCDGGTVKYGLLFRGGYLSGVDRPVLVGELGIMHDLDLRGTAEAQRTTSPIGNDVYFTCAPNYNWYSLTNESDWRINLRTVFDAVTHNEPLYFHCSAGADRTGTLACVLEGLLGMSQSDIDKDYELTCFYLGTDTDLNARRRNEADWKGLINAINAKSGTTFRDKCVTFAAELGFTADEINAFREAMIDGTPQTVTPNISTFTVSKTLQNVTTDNTATTAVQYQPYGDSAKVSNGYAISEVKITMGGTDITSTAWKGVKTVLRRKISYVLENVTLSNKSISAIDGQSYASKVTVSTGYTLEGGTIQITMGEQDASEYYESGVIAIPKVTGNIVITIKAVESAEEHENLIPTSTVPGSSAIYNDTGYMANTRYKSDSTAVPVTAGSIAAPFTTGVIPVAVGQKVRLINCWIDDDAQSPGYGQSAGGMNNWTYKNPDTSDTHFDAFTWANIATTYGTDIIYDSSNNIIGWTWGTQINTRGIKGVKFTLASNDPSKAVYYTEE